MPARARLRPRRGRGLHTSKAQYPLSGIGTAVAPVAPEAGLIAPERYEELEGHRGIAVLLIVVFHVYQFCNVSHGLYGSTAAYRVLSSLDAVTAWFFVLTAFLLFEPVARTVIAGRQEFAWRPFLRRRAVRILPAYYVAILVVWFPRQHSLPGDWRDLLEHLTFTQVFDQRRIFYTNGPASALSVEVFFYLALSGIGVGLAVTGRRIASRRWRVATLFAATAGLALVSLAWKAWSFGFRHRATTGSFSTWFGPLANMDVFAVGMAVAVIAAILGGARPIGPRVRLTLRFAGLAILVVAFVTRQAGSWSAVYFYSLCAIGFSGLVAAAVLGPVDDRWGRALRWRPLMGISAISYGIYLWHEPALLALRGSVGLIRQTPAAFVPDAVVVLVAGVLAGVVSYFFIERPTSQLGGLFRRDGHLGGSGGTDEQPVEWETFRSGSPF